MIENDLKSAFGVAYVRAIANAAGCFAQESSRERDGDGVDLDLFSRDRLGLIHSPAVQAQVKTTHSNPIGDPIQFDLVEKNYTELIDTRWQVPRILVVVFVPRRRPDWLTAAPEQMVLRHAAFWLSLRGWPNSSNSTKTRITIPRSNLLDVAAMQGIMDRVREGNLP